MAPTPPRARLTIDLAAVGHNLAALRALAGAAEVAPVIKADGYGLGSGPLARRLWAEGVRSLFIARLDEGLALREALGPRRPARIFLLDGFPAGAGSAIEAAGLTPVLSTLPQIAAARAFAAGRGRPLACALHIDTGMNRQGLTPPEARALVLVPGGLDGLDLQLVMSHLGSAAEPDDPRNAAQLAAFQAVRPLFPGVPASLSATAGLGLGEAFRFDLVRPGIGLLGGGPQARPDPRLRQAATLTAPVLDIRSVPAGARLGYGRGATAARATRLAVVGAGYADGLVSTSGQQAWAAGAPRPILSVTMDLTSLDIGDADLGPGDTVELLGPHAPLDAIAEAAGVVPHQVLTALGRRAERVWVGAAPV